MNTKELEHHIRKLILHLVPTIDPRFLTLGPNFAALLYYYIYYLQVCITSCVSAYCLSHSASTYSGYIYKYTECSLIAHFVFSIMEKYPMVI